MLEIVIVTVITALTVWAIMWRAPREKDPDSKFWYAFAGLCCLLPAVLLPAIARPLMGALLLMVALLAGAGSTMVMRKWGARTVDHQWAAARNAQRGQLSARHEAVLASWLNYELDVAKQIDFPAMNDVRVPETAGLVKALAEASVLRREASYADRASDTLLDYALAVSRLEDAFALAEAAALQAAPADRLRIGRD